MRYQRKCIYVCSYSKTRLMYVHTHIYYSDTFKHSIAVLLVLLATITHQIIYNFNKTMGQLFT